MWIVKGILVSVMGAVGVMVSIPQPEAVSNLSTWWVSFGLPPFEALRAPAIDAWVLAVCVVAVVAALIPWRWIYFRVRGFRRPPHIAPAPIPPEKTITEHGILTMGATGYPEKLTTWQQMKEGKIAPSPSPPPGYKIGGQPGPTDPQKEDREALAINAGNGWRVARLILRATLDEAERLFRDFLSQPHKDREERVFAAYWVRTCMLRGLSRQDCWHQTGLAAVDHEQKTGSVDFWGRVIPEVGEIVQEVYGSDDETPGQ